MSGYTDEQLEFLGDLEEFAEYEGRPVDDRCLELVNGIRHEFVVMKRSMATMQDADPVLNTDDLYGFATELEKEGYDRAALGVRLFVETERVDMSAAAPWN